MHIEPGVVTGAKTLLGYALGSGVIAYAAKEAIARWKKETFIAFIVKTAIATLIVFSCFEILPHYPIGVSEVHLILGTTVYLLFGLAPAMLGLAAGLLVQGLFFAPFDLPQYGINVTTLLASLIALDFVAKKIIPRDLAYKDIGYKQLLKLSVAWEGSIVAWVAFWAFYGQGFGEENIQNVLRFGSAYMGVVILEPLVDLTVLTAVKILHRTQKCSPLFFDARVYEVRI